MTSNEHVTPIIAAVVVIGLVFAPAAAAAANNEPLYNESSGTAEAGDWTTGHEDPTLSNVTHYISTLGTFVVGEHPGNPTAGPVLTGLLVGFVAVGMTGVTRTGLVGGGVAAVAASAVLTQSAGLAPSWLYGVVVMILGLVAGTVYVKMFR